MPTPNRPHPINGRPANRNFCLATPASGRCRGFPCCGRNSAATKAIFANVANWFRCRRLANASPIAVVLTQGASDWLAPKYCSKAIAQLARPANNQANAETSASREFHAPCVLAKRKPARQNQVTRVCTVDADGPRANGLHQGTVRHTSATVRAGKSREALTPMYPTSA